MVGGSYFAKHLELLAPGGRLVQIALLGGRQAAIDLRAVMNKRLLITGSMLRSRPVAEKSLLASAVEQHLWPFFEAGRLRPTVTRVFPLAQAGEAHQFMESGEHMGKLVLEVE
jgi:NADPH2:quinone reductase